MSNRRLAVPAIVASAFAVLFFGLGSFLGARPSAEADEIAALRAEVDQLRRAQPSPDRHVRHDRRRPIIDPTPVESRAAIVADVKRQLQSEMGLLPLNTASRSPAELRRALLVRRPRVEQLRHRRVPGQRLLHHRQARRHRARAGRATDPRKITSIKLMYEGRADHRPSRRLRRRARRSRSGRLGDPQGQGEDRPAGAERQSRATSSSSPTRSSGSATTTRRGSSSRPDTSASGRRTSLVTCLTDGHPGVSGGGVLNAEGQLVGIPDRPDAGGLPLLVHSSAARRDVPPRESRDRHSLIRSRIVDSKPRSVGS